MVELNRQMNMVWIGIWISNVLDPTCLWTTIAVKMVSFTTKSDSDVTPIHPWPSPAWHRAICPACWTRAPSPLSRCHPPRSPTCDLDWIIHTTLIPIMQQNRLIRLVVESCNRAHVCHWYGGNICWASFWQEKNVQAYRLKNNWVCYVTRNLGVRSRVTANGWIEQGIVVLWYEVR